MRPRPPVTMKELAAEAGVSIATVSLALRDDPRLRPDTCRRIQALAKKRGYRPDPALSALVAYRGRTRPVADFGVIAVLHDMAPGERQPPAFRANVKGITDRASELGYRTELFHIGTSEADSLSLGRTLYARGIRGLVLLTLRQASLVMQWEHFSTVVIGEFFSDPQFVHIGNHHASVLNAGYENLRALGYRRIGFCNSLISEQRKHHLYLSAYLKCLYLDGISPSDSPPLLHEAEPWSPIPWLDRHRFDAVLAMIPDVVISKLAGSRYKVPGNLAVSGFIRPTSPGLTHISGCIIDHHALGVRAMDVLQPMILRGQRGIPDETDYFDVLIRGHWFAGSTTPRRRTKA